MPIRTQDLAVLLLYYAGYSHFRNLEFRRNRKSLTRILAFHDILPEAENCFRKKLRWLKENTNVLSLDDYSAGRATSERPNVVISFDDGYKSWVNAAGPVLRELNLPATFFISSGFVGLAPAAQAEFIRSKLFMTLAPRPITGGLSCDDVKRLADWGFALGGHTVSHCVLSAQSDLARLRQEIADDKTRLQEMSGRRVDYFAYPCGQHHNPRFNLADVLAEEGYQGAVTVMSGSNDPATPRYLLRRELTSAPMPLGVFKARVSGNYDGVVYLKKKLGRGLA